MEIISRKKNRLIFFVFCLLEDCFFSVYKPLSFGSTSFRSPSNSGLVIWLYDQLKELFAHVVVVVCLYGVVRFGLKLLLLLCVYIVVVVVYLQKINALVLACILEGGARPGSDIRRSGCYARRSRVYYNLVTVFCYKAITFN